MVLQGGRAGYNIIFYNPPPNHQHGLIQCSIYYFFEFIFFKSSMLCLCQASVHSSEHLSLCVLFSVVIAVGICL